MEKQIWIQRLEGMFRGNSLNEEMADTLVLIIAPLFAMQGKYKIIKNDKYVNTNSKR